MAANWYFGWSEVLAGFVVGAGLGLRFHEDHFLGGYSSFRRRIIRLGHIALIALGMLNVLFAFAASAAGGFMHLAGDLLILGGLTMPAICFLTGWKSSFRNLFFIPVLSLISAVILILFGGLP